MTRSALVLAAISAAICCPAHADDPSFAGTWKTTFGEVKLAPEDDGLGGSFGPGGAFKIKGKVEGRTFKATYKETNAEGNLTFTLDPSGHAFLGQFRLKNGRNGSWNGWRPDPRAAEGPPAKFAGLWLTDLGLMELTQDGAKVSGTYAARGGSTIEGTATGRHLEFRYKSFGPGPGWFDLSEDGKTLSGASGPEGPGGWSGWKGRPAPEYARHAKLVPGKTVEGSTDGLLTYSARAPEGYKPGDGKAWPAILILHGSNMSGRAYVDTMAQAWQKLANDYIVIGINGETPSNIDPKNPQFNYTYVSFTGRSTYKGFPGTDKESPALVSSAMKELKNVYKITHYFVGGHSQGGFLTYSLLMNFPERIAGAFPISCGLIMQCEPSAYSDMAVIGAQRAVPLAIVHGRNDPVVAFSMGDYAARQFGDASWPALRFFTDDDDAHMFARLPVDRAIRWLEVMASDDPARLSEFAEERAKDGGWRDAIAAVARAHALKPQGTTADRIAKVEAAIDARASPDGKMYAEKIRANADASWVDGFLVYREQFEFASAAQEAIRAYATLRVLQTEPAQKLMNEARGLFQQGKRDEGYAKYREIAEKYDASPLYRDVKKALADRK